MEKALIFILTLVLGKLVISFFKKRINTVETISTDLKKDHKLTLIPFDKVEDLEIFKLSCFEDMALVGHIFQNCLRWYDPKYVEEMLEQGQNRLAVDYNFDNIYVVKKAEEYVALLEIGGTSVFQMCKERNNMLDKETIEKLFKFYKKYGFSIFKPEPNPPGILLLTAPRPRTTYDGIFLIDPQDAIIRDDDE